MWLYWKNVDTGSLSEDLTADGEWSGGPEMAPERGYFYVRTDGKLGRWMGDEKEGEKLKKMDNFCFCSDKWGDKWGDKTQKKDVVRMGYNAKIRGKTVYFCV